jgi:hypothetical protein
MRQKTANKPRSNMLTAKLKMFKRNENIIDFSSEVDAKSDRADLNVKSLMKAATKEKYTFLGYIMYRMRSTSTKLHK